mmetsp:Transcript_20824/g.67050  ORF Transcript_20824/g.67050 Transcript_20824/m.67050 type:complete len:262 (+) Transcript_20824:3-788(+)
MREVEVAVGTLSVVTVLALLSMAAAVVSVRRTWRRQALDGKILVVGSTNPCKVDAVREAVRDYGRPWKILSHAADSGVPDQPIGLDVVARGARNRAEAAARAHQDGAKKKKTLSAAGLRDRVRPLLDWRRRLRRLRRQRLRRQPTLPRPLLRLCDSHGGQASRRRREHGPLPGREPRRHRQGRQPRPARRLDRHPLQEPRHAQGLYDPSPPHGPLPHRTSRMVSTLSQRGVSSSRKKDDFLDSREFLCLFSRERGRASCSF